MKKETYIKDLSELINMPMFKNSESYSSSDWRPWVYLTVDWPVQRRLGDNECVFDLDGVSDVQMKMIPQWLEDADMKFSAWQSSDSGMHIHFFTDITGKERKKALVQFMAKKLETVFGIRNDLGPMGHGVIRTEYSFHPTKRTQKKLLSSNISPLFPENDISDSLRQKVFKYAESGGSIVGKTGERNGKKPSCVKYILSHKFSDGRERLLFVLISWWKSSKCSDEEIKKLALAWCHEQGYPHYRANIPAKIRSSSGKVGCRFRHQVLEDLGVDMNSCHWE